MRTVLLLQSDGLTSNGRIVKVVPFIPHLKERVFWYTFNNQFVAAGYDILDAMNLAVSQIQYEVRTTGRTYN